MDHFDRGRDHFDTIGQWMIWRLGVDLAPCRVVLPPGLGVEEALALEKGEVELQRFFRDLLKDMHDHPESYFIPEMRYEPILLAERPTGEAVRIHEEKKKQKRAVKKGPVSGVLDFLYRLGALGQPDGAGLRVERPAFDALVQEKIKTTRSEAFLKTFERSGFSFTLGEAVEAANPRYPGMLLALSALSKACRQIQESPFYYFRRCDFGVLGGKIAPDFADVLRLIPELGDEVRQTDALLLELGYKRVIFADDKEAGYRVRYTRKNDQAVYWCRVLEPFSPKVKHTLRWKFSSEISARLFERLDETSPGLSALVFDSIQCCEKCYGEACMARGRIQRGGVEVDVCTESAMNHIGLDHAGFEAMRTVLQALNALI